MGKHGRARPSSEEVAVNASDRENLESGDSSAEFGDELREFQVEAPVSVRGGVYADVALVSHDPDAFTVDFFATDPTVSGQAILQARVKMSHRMAVRLEMALADNLQRWAPKELAAREREQAELRELLEQSNGGED